MTTSELAGQVAENSGPHSVSPVPEGNAGSRERLDRPATRPGFPGVVTGLDKYDVHVQHWAVYSVTADSPEEAARIVSDGDGGAADWQGSNVERVVTHGEFIDQEDLRAPVPCRGGCGKLLPASRGYEWSSGLLRRVPLRSVGVRRRREGPVRRAAEAALFVRRPYCWFDGQAGVELHGHELLSRSQGGSPARPDALLCNWHNTWCEDHPAAAAWLGWKVSRKHPAMPCVASGDCLPWDHAGPSCYLGRSHVPVAAELGVRFDFGDTLTGERFQYGPSTALLRLIEACRRDEDGSAAS